MYADDKYIDLIIRARMVTSGLFDSYMSVTDGKRLDKSIANKTMHVNCLAFYFMRFFMHQRSDLLVFPVDAYKLVLNFDRYLYFDILAQKDCACTKDSDFLAVNCWVTRINQQKILDSTSIDDGLSLEGVSWHKFNGPEFEYFIETTQASYPSKQEIGINLPKNKTQKARLKFRFKDNLFVKYGYTGIIVEILLNKKTEKYTVGCQRILYIRNNSMSRRDNKSTIEKLVSVVESHNGNWRYFSKSMANNVYHVWEDDFPGKLFANSMPNSVDLNRN
jgi:hypothetical protein